jgi:hypothetical protein
LANPIFGYADSQLHYLLGRTDFFFEHSLKNFFTWLAFGIAG